MNKRFELGVLILISFLIYLPVFYTSMSGLDDIGIVRRYWDSSGFDFVRRFFSGSVEHYHRPIVSLSFYLDSKVFGAHPVYAHLTNLLIHICNGLLIFKVVGQWLSLSGMEKSRIPFLACALFLFHPIGVESVSWYAGRTDLLAGLFVLLSLHYLLRFFESKQKKLLVAVAAFAILGIFTKEVVFGFIPGLLLAWWFWHNKKACEDGARSGALISREVRKLFIVLLLGCCCLVLLIVARQKLLGGLGPHWQKILDALFQDPLRSGAEMLTAFGFYLKKIVAPWPLNYAIAEVSPFYLLPGVLGGVGILWSLLRPSGEKILYLWGCLVLATAMPVVVAKVAWTPIAERYLYVSLIFFIPALLMVLTPLVQRLHISRQLLTIMIGVVLLVFSVGTNLRAFIWTNPVLLYGDTVAKSPMLADARVHYSKALIGDLQYEEAERQLTAGSAIATPAEMVTIESHFGFLYEVQKRFDEAVDHYEKSYELGSERKKREALKFLIRLQSKRIAEAEGTEKQVLLQREQLGYFQDYYSRVKDPHLLYRMGQVALNMGDDELAIEYFQNAIEKLPVGNPYVGWAKKLVASISNKSIE